MHEVQRRRTRLGVSEESCVICGQVGLDLIRSRRVRRGRDLLRPGWDPAERTYKLCRSCNARHELETGPGLPHPRSSGD